MCGIAGLAGPDAALHRSTVSAMGTAQRHRGPDGTGVLAADDGRAVLAMNTLRIVAPDASPGPYADPATGLALTFNGEIYNWRRLADDWGIVLAPGETDAHLLLRAWQAHGPACLAQLDGMFAAAIYDPRAGLLTLVRDRLGEKPLYWRLDGGRLAFASEVATLTGYGPAPLVLRPEMLAVETPTGADTPYQGIQMLPPGRLLTFHVPTGSARQWPWWDLAAVDPVEDLDYPTALARFESLLIEQVPQRAPACDHALLLSGGLDSALLAYLMRPPVCVTVRYPGHERLDEFGIAQQVARDIGAELIVVEPGADDFRQALPPIMRALDYPMGNASTFSEYMAYRAVADRGVRVVAGGLGPDELLMGYVRHALVLHGPDAVLAAGLDAYRPLAAKLASPAGEDPDTAITAITRLVTRGPDPDRRIRALVTDALQRADGDLARTLTLVDLATSWRPLVMTSDKLASSMSIERRSPYLAADLVALAYALPASHKTSGPCGGKRILRDTARRLGLPQRIWGQRDKLGFASPAPTWLTGPLSAWADRQITVALRDAPAAMRPVLEAGSRATGAWDRTRMQALMTAAWIGADTPAMAA